MKAERDFKGVWIPKEIWLCKELSLQEKVIIVEIESLTNNEKGYCWASNAHFSDFFNLSKGRISQLINGLYRKGILEVWDIIEGKEIKERRIKIIYENSVFNFLKRGIKKTKEGYLENAKESNTNITIQKRDSFSKEKRNRRSRGEKAKDLDSEKADDLDSQIEEVLEHWYMSDGKVHQSESAKGMIDIRAKIHALLIEGANSYIKLIKDPELKMKKWTVEEIKASIDFFVVKLNKDISGMYFDKFIVSRFYNKYQTNLPDNSPLVECFLLTKDSMLTKEAELLKKKLSKKINGTPISEKVYIKASFYLSAIKTKYVLTETGQFTHKRNILNAFSSYFNEKMNDMTWEPAYIAGDTFKNEFLDEMLKRGVLRKRKAKRVNGEIIYY